MIEKRPSRILDRLQKLIDEERPVVSVDDCLAAALDFMAANDLRLLDAGAQRDIIAALDFMADKGCLTENCRTRCRELIVMVTEPPPPVVGAG